MPFRLPMLLFGLLPLVLPVDAEDKLQDMDVQGMIPIRRLVEDGSTRTTIDSDGILLRASQGWLRTDELYSDFILLAEFRLLDADADACIGVRSWINYGRPHLGYCVMLNDSHKSKWKRGSVVHTGVGMGRMNLAPPTVQPAKAKEEAWQAIEARFVRDRMTVLINGVEISSAEGLDEFTGYIALQGRRGRVQVRGLSVRRLPEAATPFAANTHRRGEPGVQLPKPIRTAKPRYPREPYQAWKQGKVWVEVVVMPDGRPGDARVIQSVHPSLDAAAVACVRQWRFRPGSKDGQPVPVVVTVELAFVRTK